MVVYYIYIFFFFLTFRIFHFMFIRVARTQSRRHQSYMKGRGFIYDEGGLMFGDVSSGIERRALPNRLDFCLSSFSISPLFALVVLYFL